MRKKGVQQKLISGHPGVFFGFLADAAGDT
jgi:hypothetical protein